MKVLEAGMKKGAAALEVPKPWWVGQKLKCDGCGARFELEERDGHRITAAREKKPGGKGIINATCPNCHGEVTRTVVVT